MGDAACRLRNKNFSANKVSSGHIIITSIRQTEAETSVTEVRRKRRVRRQKKKTINNNN